MPYVTEQEFAARFGQEELDELIEGGAVYADAAADADGIVDGYLATRYTLPLVSVPALVKAWAGDITRYRLWEERAPQEIRQRYEEAIAQLKDLALGRINLPPGADGERPEAGGYPDGFSADRLFTMDTLKGF